MNFFYLITILVFVLSFCKSDNIINEQFIKKCSENILKLRNEARVLSSSKIEEKAFNDIFISSEIKNLKQNYKNLINDLILKKEIPIKLVCKILPKISEIIESNTTPVFKSEKMKTVFDKKTYLKEVRTTNEFFRLWFEGLIPQTEENYRLGKVYDKDSILIDGSAKIMPFVPLFKDISFSTYAVIPQGSLVQGLKTFQVLSELSDSHQLVLYTGVYSMGDGNYINEILTVIFKKDETKPLGIGWLHTHITYKVKPLSPLMVNILNEVKSFNTWYKNRLEGTENTMNYFDQVFSQEFIATTADGQDHDFADFRSKMYNSYDSTKVGQNEIFNIEQVKTYENEDYVEFRYWQDYCYGTSEEIANGTEKCRTKIPTVVFKKDSTAPGGFKWYRLTVVDKKKDSFKNKLF